jgi:hypothetical protein
VKIGEFDEGGRFNEIGGFMGLWGVTGHDEIFKEVKESIFEATAEGLAF